MFITLNGMRALSEIPGRLHQHEATVGNSLRDLRLDVMSMQHALASIAHNPSSLHLRQFQRESEALERNAQEKLGVVAKGILGDQARIEATRAALAEWVPIRMQIITAIENGDATRAYTLATTESADQIMVISAHLDDLLGVASRRAEFYTQQSKTISRKFILLAVLVSVLSLLATVGVVVFVHGALMRPAADIGQAMLDIANGNLNRQIPHTNRADEVGEIARTTEVFLAHALAVQNAQLDILTGLPTRCQLVDHLELCHSRCESGTSFAVLHFDIDRFTATNDTFGRLAGDQVLVHMANVIRGLTDPGDMVAREGPDSFVLVASNGKARALKLAEEIQAETLNSIILSEQEIAVACSVGVALLEDADSAEAVLTHAENALAEARKQGEGGVAMYTKAMDQKFRQRREKLKGLKFAIDQGEIVPHFQPQIYAGSGEIAGFEALARWNHPEQGLLSPWQFLGLAESAGLLPRITEIMVAETLKQLAEWRRHGLDVPRVSLNFDAVDLRNDAFADSLMLSVESQGISPDSVCVELLESAMIEDSSDPIMRTLERLSGLGFPIELDDFGTGHAAISSLSMIELNAIKIDRSFIKDIADQPSKRNLARVLLRLAGAMQIGSVAEGVETEEIRRILYDMGCEKLQGYLIGRPMSGMDAALWLERYRPKRLRPEPARVPA